MSCQCMFLHRRGGCGINQRFCWGFAGQKKAAHGDDHTVDSDDVKPVKETMTQVHHGEKIVESNTLV